MGNPHLHGSCNFAESLVKTVLKLLCHSCGSELTRQGISLICYSLSREGVVISATHCMSPCRSDYIFPAFCGVWRIVSTDFPARYIEISKYRTGVASVLSRYLSGCSPIQPNFLLPLHGIGEVRRGSCSPLRQRFFHLRTVIVTAGVHQRFGSRLPLPCGSMTSPLNVLTLARHQPLYFSLRFRRDLCFW